MEILDTSMGNLIMTTTSESDYLQAGAKENIDFSHLLNPIQMQDHVKTWLKEDIPSLDVGGLVVGETSEVAVILCKSQGVLAGVPFVNTVFEQLNCTIAWSANEGDVLSPPICIGTVKGPARNILLGERLALNILSRASGVATAARELKNIATSKHWDGEIAGTRKTTPGFRMVEKYALLVGGVSQHRNDLSSMVMLKDNHIWSAGNITKAVKLARKACGFSCKIEVECRSMSDAQQAAAAGCDIVMLDNFKPSVAHTAASALKKEFPSVLVELSGGIRKENISEYLFESIDVVSLSALTQGYQCIDFSMKISKAGHDPLNLMVQNT